MTGADGDGGKAIIDDIGRQLQALGLSARGRAAFLALIAEHASADGQPRVAEPRSLTRMARVLHRTSLMRGELLGTKIVNDTAWNMLLDLYAAQEEGRPVYVSSLCIASGSASTTALRHIDRLEAAGLVVRYADRSDRRRTWVEATNEAVAIVHQVISELARGIGEPDGPPRRDR